jgi:hypothetical protein
MYSASGNYNTAIGYQAFKTGTYSNSTAIGYNSQPTGNYQIVLGTSAETIICGNTMSLGFTNITVPSTIGALMINGQGTGSAYCCQFYSGGSTNVGSISVTGSATTFNTSSDYRLKENVVPLVNGLERLSKIPVHRFNFITVPDITVDGFLAHEVQEIVPEAVVGTKDAVDENGTIIQQQMDHSKLVPLLTAAVQELKHELDSKTRELDAIKLFLKSKFSDEFA